VEAGDTPMSTPGSSTKKSILSFANSMMRGI
jgi:hypothetical protein